MYIIGGIKKEKAMIRQRSRQIASGLRRGQQRTETNQKEKI